VEKPSPFHFFAGVGENRVGKQAIKWLRRIYHKVSERTEPDAPPNIAQNVRGGAAR
jgi:hypothetical protein